MGQSTQHHRFRFASAVVSVSARGAGAPRTGAGELHRQCFASIGQCAGAQIWPRLAVASCWISHRLRLGLAAVFVAVVALVRYGHPLRFYITPHCPQCPAVAALKLRFVPFTASRPSGEGNGTLCKVAYAIRRWSCAVAYVSCFASVPVGGPCAGHHGTKDCGISRFAGDGYTVQRSGTGGYIVATWGKSNTEKESACYVLCSTLSLSGAVFGW